MNIFSKIATRLSMRGGISERVDDENDDQILKSAEKADSIIVAWGKVRESVNPVS